MTKMLRGILLLLVWRFTEARNTCDQFTAINDCTCPGYNSLYECTVIMGIATVWKGTAFNCQSAGNEIVLLHNTNFTSLRTETCNSGVISGRIIRANNGIYTSQLVVRVSVEMNGSTVVCAHDTGVNTPVIGSKLLTIVEDPFPPPMNIKLIEGNLTHVSFNWSQISSQCPSIQYHIVASNCGECPDITINNKVTCTGKYTQLINSHQCSFAVQTIVCDEIIGDISTAINVTVSRSGIWSNYELSSLDEVCIQGAVVLSSTVIPFGAVIGAMFTVMVVIILIFITTTAILIKSRQALRLELNLVQAKVKEQQVIYEEIAQVQDSLKSSSPTIDVGENTAYVSAIADIKIAA